MTGAIGIAAACLMLAACGSGDGDNGGSSDGGDGGDLPQVAFIPKLTGVGFFEAGGAGAEAAGGDFGLDVQYRGSAEASVAKQVELINTYTSQGYDALIVSSVSPDGLCSALKKAMDQGVVVLTWDSDTNPECRQFYISQGTPDQLGSLLVEMAAENVPTDEAAEVAFHYSSPTVTDQNQWAEVAKGIIESDTEWEIVDTVFSENQTELAVQQTEALVNANPDLKAIIAPDANALPGSAQALENLSADGIELVGFSTPNVMREYIENDVLDRFALWDVQQQGAMSVAVAAHLLDGNTLNVGDTFEAEGFGTLEVSPNSVQGYDYEADGNGIIVMPERTVFTADNIGDFDF
ncbi:autoinducer 2 ABC transporter substrate-binding protein LsrB [Ornithinimicrobium faecis]|uniref:Autoinducer 2 ABC transporter substrate-binding protein LsrB n=1 Tax=Ornithinimicrobium faecis TaxID=2934158 RepID=A0ABY4YR18_9MICO|nr:autoinducer 2 ABC transporter substrate-binding protein LsrB [Ornithinimicrobium sp. HY1793]USQ79163.1 autoinducer 2 ABC transporter substrate-binding protein LsrB [Ornithinimicrobium sp. HY1793]